VDTATAMAREIERFLSWYTARKAALAGEELFQEALSKLFGKLAEHVIDKLGDQLTASDARGKTTAAIFDKVKEKYTDLLFDHVKQAAETGAIDASQGAGIEAEAKVSETVLDVLKEHVFDAADTTMARVSGDVMGILQDAYDSGLGIDEAARNLRDNVFEDLKTWEAERIARTEIHSAQGQGSASILDQYADYEQWATAGDDRVRDSHQDLDGQIVAAGDAYSNGLLYPGDPAGDAEEVINCRCEQVAYVMPEGMMAPEGMDYFYESDLVEIPTEEAA
jgi:SPP1 gp7 family putative phage head morphogenesis protein